MNDVFSFQPRNTRSLIALAIKARTRRRVGRKDTFRSRRYLFYRVLRVSYSLRARSKITKNRQKYEAATTPPAAFFALSVWAFIRSDIWWSLTWWLSLAQYRPGQSGRPHCGYWSRRKWLPPGLSGHGIRRCLAAGQRRYDLDAYLRPLRNSLHWGCCPFST